MKAPCSFLSMTKTTFDDLKFEQKAEYLYEKSGLRNHIVFEKEFHVSPMCRESCLWLMLWWQPIVRGLHPSHHVFTSAAFYFFVVIQPKKEAKIHCTLMSLTVGFSPGSLKNLQPWIEMVVHTSKWVIYKIGVLYSFILYNHANIDNKNDDIQKTFNVCSKSSLLIVLTELSEL